MQPSTLTSSKKSKFTKTVNSTLLCDKICLSHTNKIQADHIKSMSLAKSNTDNFTVTNTNVGWSNGIKQELMAIAREGKNNSNVICHQPSTLKNSSNNINLLSSMNGIDLEDIETSRVIPTANVIQCNTLLMQLQNDVKKEQKQNRKKK